jgi:phosphate transport system substrate-binding protein
MLTRTVLVACALSILLAPAARAIDVDPDLPVYEKQAGVSGNLNSIGSDTLNNLMTYWAETFREEYPNVNIQIEGKGSSTAPPALIAGTAQLGPMSRKMKSTEMDAVEDKYGFKPIAIGVALDALALFVHKDNPVDHLTFPELDALFSSTRSSGYPNAIETWGGLGLDGPWANRPVSLYGRNSASGTYAFFKEHALFKGDFKPSVKEQPGSASVVMGITEDEAGIGYSGIGYITSGVKTVPLAEKDGQEAYPPTYDNVLSGKYPLGRMLYVYVVKDPTQPMPALTREFLKMVLSKKGQEIVVKDGYLPLPAKVVQKQLEMLD